MGAKLRADTAAAETRGQRLADRVYGQLLAFILEESLDQGDRLPSEHELSRLTAVSRPMVREALMRLQADGLIESRRGAGTFVRQRPAEHQIQHLLPEQTRARIDSFEVRIALEPVAARLAAVNRSEAELRAIKSAAETLVKALAAGQPTGEHDFALHQAIAVASHNPLFVLTLQSLNERVDGLIVPSLALSAEDDGGRPRQIQFEHIAVTDAIERGEPDMAEAAMRLHLMRARSRATAMRW